MSRRVVRTALAIAVLAAAAALAFLLAVAGPAPAGPVLLAVAEGERFESIAGELHRLGLVRSPLVFRAWARLAKRDRGVAWGDYQLTAPVTPIAILERLSLPPDPLGRVTVPEGLTVRETIALLVAKGHGDRAVFDATLADPAFLAREDLPAAGAEGYLFPDTYVFPSTMSPERILQAMVDRFHRQFDPELAERARRLGMTTPQAVTLASLIEEETAVPAERRLVSAVFHNRLRLGMRLQSDPTVLYGREDGDRRISRDDLERPTPHNTYVIAGLPPTPIANPGLSALEAAVDPADVDFLYFVARGDGTHEFSRTLAEHHDAVRRRRRVAR